MKRWIIWLGLTAVIAVITTAAPSQRAPEKVSGSEQAARIVKIVKPVYPPEAKEAGVQGLVTLRATISEEGKVVDLQVVNGHQLLTPAATEAVKQWEYQPVMKDGKAIAVIADIDVNFTLAK